MTEGSQPGWSEAPIEDSDPREERLGELVNDFFDRRQRGEALTVEGFVASHPDYADDLRKHLDGLRLLGQFGSSNDQTLPASPTAPGPRKSSDAQALTPGPPVILPDIEGYEVQRELGRGGMGVVFKALQHSTKRVVALKVLIEGEFASDASQRRFEREVELAAQLRHPNIIPIYDSGRSGGRMYYAMEYVHGRPLTEYLRAHNPPVEERLRLFIRICGAVAHAHLRGVVHRDLKPANILVDADGEPHVLDFGLAKIGGMRDMAMSITAQVIGTPAYMAPEQVAGDPTAIDPRTDVYSLGIVLYEMLLGSMPYPTTGALGDTLNHITGTEPVAPRKKNRSVSRDLETIVLKALAKRKDERYQTAHALSADVSHYLAGEPIEARRASALYLIGKALWPHRHFAAAVALILILGGSLLFVLMRQRTANLAQQTEMNRVLKERIEADERAAAARAEKEQSDEMWARRFSEILRNAPKEVIDRFAQQAEKPASQTGGVLPTPLGVRAGVSLLERAAELIDKNTPGAPATQPTPPPAPAPAESPPAESKGVPPTTPGR